MLLLVLALDAALPTSLTLAGDLTHVMQTLVTLAQAFFLLHGSHP